MLRSILTNTRNPFVTQVRFYARKAANKEPPTKRSSNFKYAVLAVALGTGGYFLYNSFSKNTDVGKQAQKTTELAIEKGQKAANYAAEASKGAAKSIENKLNSPTGEKAVAVATAAADKGKEIAEGIKEGVSNALTKSAISKDSADKGKDAVEKGADKVKATADNAKAAAEKGASKAKDATDEAARKTEKAADKSKEGANKAADKGKEAADEGKNKAEKVGEKSKEGANKAADKSKDLSDKGKETGNKASDKLEHEAKKGADKTKDTAEKVSDKGKDAANKAADKVKETADKANDSAQKGADKAKKEGKDAATEVSKKAKDVTEKGKEVAKKAVDKGKEPGEKVADKGKEVAAAAKQKTEEAVNKTKEGASSAKETIKETTKGAADKAKDVANKVAGKGQEAADKGKQAAEKGKEAANASVEKGKDASKKASDATKDASEKGKENVKKAAKEGKEEEEVEGYLQKGKHAVKAAAATAAGVVGFGGQDKEEELTTGELPGDSLSLKKKALATGANVLQTFKPIKTIHQNLNGIHFYCGEPDRQVVSEHFCSHLNNDFQQCVIYDGNDSNARLIGIEYIISERIYNLLPADEQKLWHSHTYEVKSGLLVAPGVPERVERSLMTEVAKTYGKTFHTWQVDKGDPVPLGIPQLMMSFTQDGQIDSKLLQERDEQLGIDHEALKKSRENIADRKAQGNADHWQSETPLQTSIAPTK